MDVEDDSVTYLKFLNDGIGDSFFIEPIFTEIETIDWQAESLPILLHNSSNDINVGLDVSEYNGKTDQKLAKNPTDNFYVARNDIYLHVDESNVENQVINVSINEEKDGSDNNDEILQLLNPDGTLTTVTKSILNMLRTDDTNNSNNLLYRDFYSTVQAHKCNICKYLTESVTDITAHLNEKHSNVCLKQQGNNGDGKTVKVKCIKMSSILNKNTANEQKTLFVCSECTTAFTTKEDLKNHMVQEHKFLVSNSSVTKEDKSPATTTNSTKNLSKLLVKKQAKALKKVKCTIKGCSLRFAKDELRERHEKCHISGNNKQFKCTECEEKFSIWKICSNHLWKCHKIDLGFITCPMCNKFKSNSAVRVLTHMAIHNQEKPFLCNHCGRTFKQLAQLKNHEVIHKTPEELPNWSCMKECTICGRYLANAKSLKKHIQIVHEKFKPFICNICGHKTARKAMLELHLRQHTGQKPHHCEFCSYKTSDRNCLRRHMMRHSGEMKYSCPYCDYASIQSHSFKNHVAHKHPDKESSSFKCTYCSYTTVNAASYSSHIKAHEIALKNKNNKEAQNGTNEVESLKTKVADPIEDEETQNAFIISEETVDKGGITIPADDDENYLVT